MSAGVSVGAGERPWNCLIPAWAYLAQGPCVDGFMHRSRDANRHHSPAGHRHLPPGLCSSRSRQPTPGLWPPSMSGSCGLRSHADPRLPSPSRAVQPHHQSGPPPADPSPPFLWLCLSLGAGAVLSLLSSQAHPHSLSLSLSFSGRVKGGAGWQGRGENHCGVGSH